jgi:hypothetical protein
MAELRNAYLEAANPIFAAQSALNRYTDAQEDLAEVQKDGKSTAQDVAQAELDVAAAALEAEGALSELADGDLDAGIGVIAEALGKSDDEARELLVTLGLLDGTNVTSTVTTEYRTVTRNDNFRHSGGPGEPGVPYTIRPDEEIFVPSGRGQFMLNSDVINALRNVGGNTTNSHAGLNITVNNPVHRGDDILDSIQKATTLLSATRFAETTPGRG